jgi:hypothetical protein
MSPAVRQNAKQGVVTRNVLTKHWTDWVNLIDDMCQERSHVSQARQR